MRNARCDYVGISDTQWPPIWLAYCGALLEERGHKVKLVDAPAEKMGHKEALEESKRFSPELTVVYSSTKSEDNDIEFAVRLKDETGCRLVFVGPFVSLKPNLILEKSSKVEYAVKGEFEHPVLELAEGRSERKVKNVVWRDGGRIIRNEARPLLNTKQLDELPFVTKFYRKHVNMRNYRPPSELYPLVDLFTGRGCYWGKCTYCLWVHSFIPGSVYNTRSIGNVMDEFAYVKENMKGIKEIFIQDDTLPKERVVELSKAILDHSLSVTWSCYVRGDLDYKTLTLMKKAGCRTLHVGYESASNEVLKQSMKGLTREQMTKFTEDAKKAGLKIHGDFLIGLPGETKKTVRDTIEWAKKLDPDTAQFSLINIYPGTPLYEHLKKNNFIKDNEPSYPNLTNEELRELAKKGVREFYVSFRYARRALKQPREYFIPRLRTAKKTLPYMLWRQW
jgi:radical SAM superfamily enzyme YgiQ (UPF0313 family)